jgi:hypothetical protein
LIYGYNVDADADADAEGNASSDAGRRWGVVEGKENTG